MRQEIRELTNLQNRMAETEGFRPSYRKVFDKLLQLENAKSGTTQPAQGVIARLTKLHRVTVNRAVTWLRLHGFILAMQRTRTIARGKRWFLSLKYWVAKELGQVAFLEQRAKRARIKQWMDGKLRPKKLQLPCSPETAPPSRTELYSSFLSRFEQKKNAFEGGEGQI